MWRAHHNSKDHIIISGQQSMMSDLACDRCGGLRGKPRPSLAIRSLSHSVSDWSFPELARTAAVSARLKV